MWNGRVFLEVAVVHVCLLEVLRSSCMLEMGIGARWGRESHDEINA